MKPPLDSLAELQRPEPTGTKSWPLLEPVRKSTYGKGGRYSRMNRIVAGFVVASAVLCAIPIGLNRPTLWMIWLGAVATTLALFLVLGSRFDRGRQLISLGFLPVLLGAAVIPVWAVVQATFGLGGLVPEAAAIVGAAAPQISLLPSASLIGALRVLGYVLFAVLALEVSVRSSRAEAMAKVVFWGVVVHALWALVALNLLGDIAITGEPKTAYVGSATGTFLNRNSLASFLSMGAVLGLVVVLDMTDNPKRRRSISHGLVTPELLDRVIMLVGIGVIWVALLSTSSRMGVIAGAIGMAVAFVAMKIKRPNLSRRAVLLSLSAGAVIVAVGIAAVGQDLAWRAIFAGRDLASRFEGYGAILSLISDRPLLGYGFDTFRPAFELIKGGVGAASTIWDRGHSTYLTYWLEMGLIVGTLPVVIGCAILWRLVRTFAERSSDYALPAAGIAVLASQGLHSVTDFGLEMPANMILLITIVALGLSPRGQGDSGQP